VQGWDVVPVIVQDPTWEQSFPRIDGVLVALGDAHGEDRRHVRLSESEVEERRKLNETRLETLRHDFLRLGLDPILVGEAEPARVHAALLAWAQSRLAAGRGAH
jgi:hypothetical protein